MKNLLTALLALAVTAPAFGGEIQDGGRTLDENAANRLEYLAIVLDLSEEQAAGFRDLQVDHVQRMKDIKDQYQPLMDSLRSELEDIRHENMDTEGKFGYARNEARSVRDKYEEKLIPMRDALKSEKDAFNDQLVTILSDEQQQKYEQLKDWKERSGPKMKHPHCRNGQEEFKVPARGYHKEKLLPGYDQAD
jgi:gas vesicle protein